jgi:large subunit ribosomal protein L22
MQAKAIARNLDVSARKARLVVDVVRGKPVPRALAMLRFMPQKSASFVYKVIASAAANAENNYSLDTDSLYVSEIYVDEGPTQRRFRPRSHGRVSPLLKRSSHITAVVAEKEDMRRGA